MQIQYVVFPWTVSASLADLLGPTSSSWCGPAHFFQPFLRLSRTSSPRSLTLHPPSQSHPSRSRRAHLRAGSPAPSPLSRPAHLSDRPVRPHQPRALRRARCSPAPHSTAIASRLPSPPSPIARARTPQEAVSIASR